jgi:uncharacterized protein (TIGR00255 family)
VNVAVTLERSSSSTGSGGSIDMAAARRALHELKTLRDELALAGEISLDLVLSTPGVLRSPTDEMPQVEAVWPLIREAAMQALEKMKAMRRKEGKTLVADLMKRVRLLETAEKGIRSRIPALTRHRRDHLVERLHQLGVQLVAGDPSVARELALMAERSDITEEMTRLQSHFTQFRESLSGSEPAGRTLDYLAQEMFREFNTLGNKAGDAAISQRVVQSKAELDRIREQVANLE